MDETNNSTPNLSQNVSQNPPSTTPLEPTSTNSTNSTSNGTSQDTRTIVTVLLLIFVFPIGLLMMWFWSRWKVWIKLLVTAPILIICLLVIPAIVLVAINPAEQFDKAKQTQGCQEQCEGSNNDSCVTECLENASSSSNNLPEGIDYNSYKEAFEASFVSSCLEKSDGNDAYCSCTFKYIEDNVSDLTNESAVLTSAGKAVNYCVDKAK